MDKTTKRLLITTVALEAVGWGMQIAEVNVPVVGWLLIIGGGITLLWMFYRLWRDKDQSRDHKDDSLKLLSLLDDVYQRLRLITRQTIRKLRSENWKHLTVAYPYLMGLTDIDVESAIESIMIKNIYYLMTGKPMTVEEEGKQLAEQIKHSPLFTRNPEHIAKDASVILKEKLPYLKKKIDRDHKYNKLLKYIERERDRFPSETISNTIDEYLDHSIKINAAWVLSTYDLDHMGEIESMVGRHIPMKFKVILWGLPGRMDEEMRRYRNNVAIAILKYHQEQAR